MYLPPKRISEPGERILTLEEAKLHLKVEPSVTDDDTLIEGLIEAAESHMDGYSGLLGRCMVNQQWEQYFSRWPMDRLYLAFPDVSSVEVAYFDAENVEQTVPSADYLLLESARGSYIQFLGAFSAPSLYDRDDAITVTMTAGYGASRDDVPRKLRQAAKLLIGAWYENRENTAIGVSVASLPDDIAFKALINGVRRVEF